MKKNPNEIMGGVLDDLTADMDEYAFEKKIKPLLTITIGTPEGGEMEEEPEEVELPDMDGDGEEPDTSGMDPRLAKKLKGLMG